MQNHNDGTIIKTSGHRSLEKYTSHFIERVVCERELETEQNCNISNPTLMVITAYLSVLLGCLTGGLGAQPLWDMVLIPASSLQLIWGSELQLLNRGSWGPPLLDAGSLYNTLSPTDWTSCAPSYIIIWCPLFFLRASQFRTQFNPSTVKVISWYSSTGCTCYWHRCISYFDSLAGLEVNMQQFILDNAWNTMLIIYGWLVGYL